MKLKLAITSLIALGLVAFSYNASAETKTVQIPVSVHVNNSNCSSFTKSGDLSLGNYSPTDRSALTNNITLDYVCSINMPVTISFASQNEDGTDIYMVKSGVDFESATQYQKMKYYICSTQPSSGTCDENSNAITNDITGSGAGLQNAAVSEPLYAVLPAGDYVEEGDYTDTLTATLSW